MTTLNQSIETHQQLTAEILADVEATLSAQADDGAFPVNKFAKQVASERGCDELFVAHLVRAVVKSCDEYKSVRGPHGGVKRVVETTTSVAATPAATDDKEPVVVSEPTPTVNDEASAAEIAESLSSENDNSGSDDLALDA